MPESEIKPAIGWFIGVQKWAFRNLVSHLTEALPDYEHKLNKVGDINVLLAMDQFDFCDGDKTIIIHVDGNRWAEAEMRKKISSVEFESGSWSWGVVANHLKECATEYDIESVDFNQWRKHGSQEMKGELILSQNVVQLEYLYNPEKTIARMGGNRSFDRKFNQVRDYLRQMSKCYAVVATNKNLENIGKMVNPNTHLIQNGIDLTKWKPQKGKFWHPRSPIVGFIGNIASEEKSNYKGFPQLQQACRELHLALLPALYKQRQIPHHRMLHDFYYKIDVFVLPTIGEGSNNSIMEALSAGIPVITTRTAGYHGETMEHGENVLFCERTTESIKEQLSLLTNNQNLIRKLSENGRKYALQHHDITDITDKYRKIFDAYFAGKEE